MTSFVHNSGVVHRILQPGNIWVDRNFNVKVHDFGLSAPIAGLNGNGLLTTMVGDFNSMPPEVWLGQPYYGSSVDIFLLGITLFNMYTGQPPF